MAADGAKPPPLARQAARSSARQPPTDSHRRRRRRSHDSLPYAQQKRRRAIGVEASANFAFEFLAKNSRLQSCRSASCTIKCFLLVASEQTLIIFKFIVVLSRCDRRRSPSSVTAKNTTARIARRSMRRPTSIAGRRQSASSAESQRARLTRGARASIARLRASLACLLVWRALTQRLS